MKQDFILLQINDALFPIGGYSHSYGLETYIAKNLIADERQAEQYIYAKLRYGLLYSELLAVRLAWEAAAAGQLERLGTLSDLYEASRTAEEVREASHKLASRFVKTVSVIAPPFESEIFAEYLNSRRGEPLHHAIVYGVFCAACGIDLRRAAEAFLYAQTSAMVTNCVKAVPLSQTAGQRLLGRCIDRFDALMEELLALEEDRLCQSAPGFDLRCMQHEGLYSRIYMS